MLLGLARTSALLLAVCRGLGVGGESGEAMYLLLAKSSAGVRARWRLSHPLTGAAVTQESGASGGYSGNVIAMVLR